MKALQLLETLKDDYIHGELTSDIDEAIKEIEAYKTNYQGVKRRLDSTVTALAVLTNENKSLVKTLEKMNEEMIDLRKENQDLKSRSCDNCKHYKQSSSQDYKSCYEIKINGFNFESEKDFYCKNWELKNERD